MSLKQKSESESEGKLVRRTYRRSRPKVHQRELAGKTAAEIYANDAMGSTLNHIYSLDGRLGGGHHQGAE